MTTTNNKIGILLLLSVVFLTTIFCQLMSTTKNNSNNSNNANNLRRHLQKTIFTLGGGTPPASELPLAECEGDCDDDHHCDVGLVCFQRSPNQAVPGCAGGETDGSRGCVTFYSICFVVVWMFIHFLFLV
jgi:hypothetical protein